MAKLYIICAASYILLGFSAYAADVEVHNQFASEESLDGGFSLKINKDESIKISKIIVSFSSKLERLSRDEKTGDVYMQERSSTSNTSSYTFSDIHQLEQICKKISSELIMNKGADCKTSLNIEVSTSLGEDDVRDVIKNYFGERVVKTSNQKAEDHKSTGFLCNLFMKGKSRLQSASDSQQHTASEIDKLNVNKEVFFVNDREDITYIRRRGNVSAPTLMMKWKLNKNQLQAKNAINVITNYLNMVLKYKISDQLNCECSDSEIVVSIPFGFRDKIFSIENSVFSLISSIPANGGFDKEALSKARKINSSEDNALVELLDVFESMVDAKHGDDKNEASDESINSVFYDVFSKYPDEIHIVTPRKKR